MSDCIKCGQKLHDGHARDGVCDKCSGLSSLAPTGSALALPTVAGRRIRGSNADFERACLVHIERLQNGLGDYDSAMLDTFCEAVRLCREYSDAMAMPNAPGERQPTPGLRCTSNTKQK